jgi:hypothetical protein
VSGEPGESSLAGTVLFLLVISLLISMMINHEDIPLNLVLRTSCSYPGPVCDSEQDSKFLKLLQR